MVEQTKAFPHPVTLDDQDESRSSSSSTSPAPADNEESDFFLGANDSQSSLGVPNFQDIQVDDACWPPANRLPNEILISIFARLSASVDLYHCMLVSKRWARNAVDLLWHRPACTNWDNHSSICQTLGLESPFFNYRDFIKRLNLASLADDVNDGSVQPLAVCSRIERLTLTNCRNLTDSGLIALISNSLALLALDISNDKSITEQSIIAIAEHCKRLQGLNISGCENISNESMITLAQNCRYIKRLKLNECAQLRDNAILAFAEHCPNILEIDLHQCAHIGNGPVTSLLSQSNCLRELRLASCDLIDDGAFLSLPTGHTYEHLRILDLTSCTRLTDAAVQKIISVAPRLRNLVLAKCRNITDVAVHAISNLGKNLHYVHLGHCVQITDEGVKLLVQNCNRIRYIDLGCCGNLTDDSVKRLANLPKLKRIGLVKCHQITDDSVFTLAEAAYRPRYRRDASGGYTAAADVYASSLERVHLSYCVNLTLKSVMRLLNSCPRLTHLSLTGVAAFQREEFQEYCRAAPEEFTAHQRDVFCVFSGNMVARFREFLNTSPRFEDLRESHTHLRYPLSLGRPRPGGPGRPREPTFSNAVHAADEEVYDDEMADEENDFQVLDTNGLMAVDGHGRPSQPAHTNGNARPLTSTWPHFETPEMPVPPPAPAVSQQPFNIVQNAAFAPSHPSQSLPASLVQASEQNDPSITFTHSSNWNQGPAATRSPLSTRGYGRASLASLAQASGLRQLSAPSDEPPIAGPPIRASTASMHGQQSSDRSDGELDGAN